jgi:hypothetical protein
MAIPRWTPKTPDERLDYLYSVSQIKDLVARYALAVDTRDLDTLESLWVEDVRINGKVGRPAMRDFFAGVFCNMGASIHFIGNHIIDVETPDRATGVLYCRDELECPMAWPGIEWGMGVIQYWDRYERRGGEWLFVRRRLQRWYMVDRGVRPTMNAGVSPGGMDGRLPEVWPSWEKFWREEAKRPNPAKSHSDRDSMSSTSDDGKRCQP